MASGDFLGEDFITAVRVAGARARMETLKAGVPVFYLDAARGLDVMEQPNGQLFEIRYLPGKPRGENYEVLRKLDGTAA